MNKTKQTNPCVTFTVRTPRGGLHLYFKFTASNSDDDAAVAGNLTSRTKFRGAGLDVRAEGGYVVAPPSVLDCKAWPTTARNSEYVYCVTDEEFCITPGIFTQSVVRPLL
jgi:hypothetical protein